MNGSITGVLLQTDGAAMADGPLLASFLDRLNDLLLRYQSEVASRVPSSGEAESRLATKPFSLHIIGPSGRIQACNEAGILNRDVLVVDRIFEIGTPILAAAGQIFGASSPDPDTLENRHSLLVFASIAPLLDVEGSLALIRNHLQYRTHYSYSDTAVPGLFPDCLAMELVQDAPDSLRGATSLDELRAFVFRNIQDFDLDLHYAEPDLRMFRLNADGRTDRSRSAAHRLLAAGLTSHTRMRDALAADLELLAPSPSWIEVEWTTRRSGRPVIYPVSPEEDLSLAVQQKILSDLERFPFSRDVTICIGGRGDPFLAPGLTGFVQALARCGCVRAIMIETDGTVLTRKMLESLVLDAASDSGVSVELNVIVRLPSLRPERYRRWMGSDRLQDVLSFLDSVATAPLPFPVYAEMIRMTENEDELDDFMERYGETGKMGPGVRALVGKYSRYGGALPDQAAVDLSPLVRDYCRHLAFDLMITAAGSIPLCRQHIGGQAGGLSNAPAPALDLLSVDLLTAFRSHRNCLALSLDGQFEEISSSCAACDDWYVFNG